METFRDLFNIYLERPYNMELSYEGTLNYLQLSLFDLHRLNIRIILGFFGPEETRMVLCEVSVYLFLDRVISWMCITIQVGLVLKTQTYL